MAEKKYNVLYVFQRSAFKYSKSTFLSSAYSLFLFHNSWIKMTDTTSDSECSARGFFFLLHNMQLFAQN